MDIKYTVEKTGAVSEVRLRNNGKVFVPTTIRVFFADGTYQDWIWELPDKDKIIIYEGELSITRAVVDPERKILIDTDYSNNQKMVGKEDDILKIIEEKYLEIIKAFTQFF